MLTVKPQQMTDDELAKVVNAVATLPVLMTAVKGPKDQMIRALPFALQSPFNDVTSTMIECIEGAAGWMESLLGHIAWQDEQIKRFNNPRPTPPVPVYMNGTTRPSKG
jgi:hypothetical protein